jgi:hypothetical protein
LADPCFAEGERRWQAKSDPICFERFRVDELATLCVLEGRIVKARLV